MNTSTRRLALLLVLGLLPSHSDPLAANMDRILLRSRTIETPAGMLEQSLSAILAATPGDKTHLIVRFERPPSPLARQRLLAAGAVVQDYLPGGAWIVTVPRGLPAARLAAEGATWVAALESRDRMRLGLAAGTPSPWAVLPDGRIQATVSFWSDVSATEARLLVSSEGAIITDQDPDQSSIEIVANLETLRALANDDAVRWITETPPPRLLANDASRALIHADEAQAPPYSLSGAGVSIGIWDGGKPDPMHPDFAGRLTVVDAASVDRHSTHVAGTMSGSGANSVTRGGGTPGQWRGVAPAATILSYTFVGNLNTKIYDAVNNHGKKSISISNNSWSFAPCRDAIGSGCACDCSGCDQVMGTYFNSGANGECDDYDRFVRGDTIHRPISVVFAAGNMRDGLESPRGCACGFAPCESSTGWPYANYGTVTPPGTAKNVIDVGAIRSVPEGTMTPFSDWGPTDDGRLKPDLVAIGAGQQVIDYTHVKSAVPGGGYEAMSGTSMAVPAVSGTLALLIEAYRSLFDSNPLPSTLKALVLHTAVDLDDPATSFYRPGPDFASGWGVLDARAAADKLRAASFLEDEIGDGTTIQYDLPVTDGSGGVRVTLVWDDPPPSPAAAVQLVNDLDLVVLDPDGTANLPWLLDHANPSMPASRGADHINNIEQVYVPGPVAAGSWTVQVRGTLVPIGPQKYSIVFTPDRASFVPFGLAAPDDVEAFAPDAPPAAFSWNKGAYTQFRVRWSPSPSFGTPRRTSGTSFLDGSSFTPSATLWTSILKMGKTTPTIYWDVQAKNYLGNLVSSGTRTIMVDAARPALVLSPPEPPDPSATFSRSSPPALFTWDSRGNQKERLIFSAKPTLTLPRTTSGTAWLTGASWTPTATQWTAILNLAAKSPDGQTVYYRIHSLDSLGRATDGAIRTFLVTP